MYNSRGDFLIGTERGTNPVAIGRDTTGANTYATVITPAAGSEYDHMIVSLIGSSYGAIISLDGGTTEFVDVPANGAFAFDGLASRITAGVAIQAKNLTAGSNYTNLSITLW